MIYGTLAFVTLLALSLRYHWWRPVVSYRHPRVLMYHSVSSHRKGEKGRNKWCVPPDTFARQMAWLAKHGWTSMTVTELVRAATIPPKTFVLTFDDGFADNAHYALPILQRYGFKATVYLVPGATRNVWEGDERLLSSQEIETMRKTGLIEFGSHTLTHRNLTTLASQEAREEIVASKEAVEALSQEPCVTFAYPYGKYTPDLVQAVREAGYESAVIVKRGTYDPTERYAIRRIGILGTESFVDFYLKVTRIRNKF